MPEVAEAYAGCRARIRALVEGLDEKATATRVPACPEWSVRDVVAHVAGIVDDALGGRLDGVATERWTRAQVEARREMRVADILAAWDAQAPAFEGVLDAIGDPGRQAVLDVATHEQDIRGALRRPGARDVDAVRIGLGFLVPGFVQSAAARGVAVRVRSADGQEWGAEAAELTLTGDAFDLVRAMTGRRSVDQLRAMKWDGDPGPAIPAFTFGPFRPAAEKIEE